MTLLLMLLFKSLLVLALSGMVLVSLRRASASARHLVCLVTLCALLALPLFSLTLPAWHVAVTQAQERKEPTPVRPSPALPAREGEEAGPEALSVPAAPSLSESSLTERTPAKQEGGFSWPLLLLAFYLLGVTLASLRPLLGLWGIAHLRRTCVDVPDAPALGVLADCAAALKLKRLPRLCRADVPVPMTWGWRRPVVLLPLGSGDWPEGRLHSVLLHEMAHVKRRDWLSHRLADLACALYWFHPLVWLTARRLRAESEIACDDLVLASGIPAPDYARHLLDIAQALPPTSRPPQSAAIAMAQTSRIKGRITMILDKTQSRRAVTRRALLIALIPSAAALLTLAALRPSVKAEAAPAQAEPQAVPAQLAGSIKTESTTLQTTIDTEGRTVYVFSPDLKINGTTLFAGMTEADKPGSPWWSAAGAVLPTPVYDTDTYHAENHAGPDTRNISFAFRLPPSATDMTVRYELPQSLSSSSDGSWPTKLAENAQRTEAQIFSKTSGTRVVTAAFPPSLTKASLRVGVASGAWKTAAVDGNLTGTSGYGNQTAFLFSSVAVTKEGLTLCISNNATEDVRVVAVTTQGQVVLPDQIGDNSVGALDQITAQFTTLTLSQIKEVRVETRPFQWVEFRDVALKPVQ